MPTNGKSSGSPTSQIDLTVAPATSKPTILPVLPDYGYLPAPTADQPTEIAALYIHVPFCSSKCHYCDFYSVAGKLDQIDGYLAALEREIQLSLPHFAPLRPQTIFIGGGTPTLLSAAQLNRLLGLIKTAIGQHQPLEYTVEANPNTFDLDRAKVLAAHGVNRLSFGAQSFIPEELITLQRDHNPENVAEAMKIARHIGITNINLDLIFGTPQQTLADWDYSLQQALALNPQHLSCYSLIYEPNTPMTARLHAGEFAILDEDLELDLFQHTYNTLRNQGFSRYETSNYALITPTEPDRRCQHNLHYWHGRNYLGWGPAAASGYQGYHWKNVASLTHYQAALNATHPILPLIQVEHLEPLKRVSERLMLGLRLTEGVNFDLLQAQTGIDPEPLLAPILRRYEGLGFFEPIDPTIGPRGLRISEKAVPISDALLREVMAACQTPQ